MELTAIGLDDKNVSACKGFINMHKIDLDVEKLWRPAIHFSPPSGWTNDPCGLIYHKGIYHLYYQHNPYAVEWGPMHWGHARSTNFLTWEQAPVVLQPDEMHGMPFTGSTIHDPNGSIVAVYTGWFPPSPTTPALQQQYRAVSEDGSAFRPEGIAIANPNQTDFRDPKVGYIEDSHLWYLVLAVGKELWFYSSEDLRNWQLESDFSPDSLSPHGTIECPNIVPIRSDNQSSQTWLLSFSVLDKYSESGMGTYYIFGSFDGRCFAPESRDVLTVDHGRDFYAAQSWSDMPRSQNRQIWTAWAMNWEYARMTPTGMWRGAMALPRELSVSNVDNSSLGPKLVQRPIREIFNIQSEVSGQRSVKTDGRNAYHVHLETDSAGSVVLHFGEAGTISISWNNDASTIDRSNLNMGTFSELAESVIRLPSVPSADSRRRYQIDLVVDHSMLELFTDGGESTATMVMFPSDLLSLIQIRLNQESGSGEHWIAKLYTNIHFDKEEKRG